MRMKYKILETTFFCSIKLMNFKFIQKTFRLHSNTCRRSISDKKFRYKRLTARALVTICIVQFKKILFFQKRFSVPLNSIVGIIEMQYLVLFLAASSKTFGRTTGITSSTSSTKREEYKKFCKGPMNVLEFFLREKIQKIYECTLVQPEKTHSTMIKDAR